MSRLIPLNALNRSEVAMSQSLHRRVLDVLESGWYSMGPTLEQFERELGQTVGSAIAVAGVASGTDALKFALQALGCRKGATILTAPNAGGYSSIAAASLGIRVRMADIDPLEHVLTRDSISAAWHDDIDVVVVTHLYGNVADAASIVDWCHARGAKVLEDCAQAAGAYRNDIAAGSFGDAACFSFYPTKNLGAAGDGGAVVSSDPEIVAQVRTLRQYGWSEKYMITFPGGTNSRLDEIQAAILLETLAGLDERNRRRVEIAGRYLRVLERGPFRLVTQTRPGNVAHLGVVQAPTADSRARARAQLHDMGVATDVHYPRPDHLQAGLDNILPSPPTPNADWACSTVFSIPCFPELTESEIDFVEEALSCLSEGYPE